jgi:hypothetical protein
MIMSARIALVVALLLSAAGCRRVAHAVEAPVHTTSHVVHDVIPHRR